jgi:hypothetical protein
MERGGFNGYRKIPNASSGKLSICRERRELRDIYAFHMLIYVCVCIYIYIYILVDFDSFFPEDLAFRFRMKG